jgi:hypothetical protein
VKRIDCPSGASLVNARKKLREIDARCAERTACAPKTHHRRVARALLSARQEETP